MCFNDASRNYNFPVSLLFSNAQPLKQNQQVVRTLRQAFCDQSDGRARTEAIASLLLSEHHLTAETAQPTATAATTTMKNFLETREALCLGADVSAHVHPQTYGVFSPGAAALVPSGAETRGEQQRHSGSLPDRNEHHHTKANMDSVLRELDEKKEERKRRLLRRQRRRRRRRGEKTSHSSRLQERQSDADAGGIDDDDDLHDEEHPQEELDNGEEHESRNDDDDGRWPPHGRKPSAASHFESGKERGNANANVSLPRLALAASVSTLGGLLGSPKDRGGGECDRLVLASL